MTSSDLVNDRRAMHIATHELGSDQRYWPDRRGCWRHHFGNLPGAAGAEQCAADATGVDAVNVGRV